jgi:hypothetical protein
MHADESVEDAVRTAARLECAHVPRLEEEAPSDAEDDARVPSQPQLFSEPLGSKNTKAPSLLGSEDTRLRLRCRWKYLTLCCTRFSGPSLTKR